MRESLAVAMLCFAGLAHATTVTATRDGTAVAAEVCRFRAGDPENPFLRWLLSQDVICEQATSIDLAPGLWNVFARTTDSVSLPRTVSGESAPPSLAFELLPATPVTADANGVVYVPRFAAAYPVVQSRVLIPAGEESWLIPVEKSKPVALTSGPATILGWIRVSENDQAAIANIRGLASPIVSAKASGSNVRSDALAALGVLDGSFVRIRGVNESEATLAIGGRGWVPQSMKIKPAGALTIVTTPLVAQPSATVIVNWSTAGDVVALDRSLGSCGAEGPHELTLSIATCAAPAPGEREPSSCSGVHQEIVDPRPGFGEVTLDDIPPGWYRAELRIGKLPAVVTSGNVRPAQVSNLTLNMGYYEVYGSVTFGGEPLGRDAEIGFPRGYGFIARNADEYRAALSGQLFDIDAQVKVSECDGKLNAVVLTDHPVGKNARFDIDIPDNEIVVRVSDAFTRAAIEGATVNYSAMSQSRFKRVALTRTMKTANGIATMTSLPSRDTHITVTNPGYEKQNLEPFTMDKSGRKLIDVSLVPLNGTHGKVNSAKPFANASIVWFSPSGMQTERAEIAEDGTFVFAKEHGSAERLSIVSASHPLFVMQSPAIDSKKNMNITFPDVPSRSFDVSAWGNSPRFSRYIGLMIGGIRVPQPVLEEHQSLRRDPTLMTGNGPLPLQDIAGTGSIDVIVGPISDQVAPAVRAMDLFALPEFEKSPRLRLPEGATTLVINR